MSLCFVKAGLDAINLACLMFLSAALTLGMVHTDPSAKCPISNFLTDSTSAAPLCYTFVSAGIPVQALLTCFHVTRYTNSAVVTATWIQVLHASLF